METRVGLVLGKFAPLHKGHQYLIETALAQVDRLYVLVYEDEGLSKVSLTKRAAWIRKLYPTAHVIPGHGSPTRTGMDAETIRIQDAYIKDVMPERITHVFASEKYVAHVAAALRAAPVLVDQERLAIPMSATRVRDNPFKLRAWVDPIVYRDLIYKVVVLGAESTGKTTLVEALAKRYNTTFAAEHGREFWIKHNRDGKLDGRQLEQLALEHRAKEDAQLANANRVFFTDTNAFTTLQFAHHYEEAVSSTLLQMAREDMGPNSRHDLRIVCDTDIPFEQDGTRLNTTVRDRFQEGLIHEFLTRRGGPIWTIVNGPLDERIRQVRYLIKAEIGLDIPS